jgi:serine/threonine protein kinase
MDETWPPPGKSSRDHSDPRPAPASDSNTSAQPERFAPGLIIGARYRIVSRLGRGGMGEVYRADDQRLGTSVALKFLPVSRSLDPVWRDRLLGEVKVAREVTHPNVCRVFDLAEHDGQFFLSMQYIDGEDLSSLLRRIGRFPEDKALEIARQICLGLAAAHEEGVLHRDLKPANVMLDGRGRIKITDFGLAALTEKLEGPEARCGTVAYMAPEQKEGREVTRKSDIYSLGLVLYYVFTGKTYDPPAVVATASKGSSAAHSSQGSHAASSCFNLDPAISRVLTRCLKNDPGDRPNTAFAVAAALPGADPLQAALAAGETPSPEMVAEAGGDTPFSRPLLAASLVMVFVCAFANFWIWDAIGIARRGNLSKSPEALMELSRQVVKEMGYSPDAVDSGDGFSPFRVHPVNTAIQRR